ncbi:hypothetical protein HPP92_015924 [Vanilla planifolia]|uniref:Uncharacterized protein n=1 Tax=Vanilla planifolia TaxID=51239 RepID=A0A835UU49_VANPL|nr:hypothetical protein HPP92_015924 [Vanilla planifolia]
MVFCSGWVVVVGRTSANWWQYVVCNPERLSNDEILRLLVFIPLHHLRRIALGLFSFLCFPLPSPHRIHRYRETSSSSSSFSDDSDNSDEDSGSHTD